MYAETTKNVNMKKFIFTSALLAATVISLNSCKLDEGQDMSKFYANALVTVKHTDGGVFYLQLDDETTVKPSNLKKSPFGDKQVRALANISEVDATDVENEEGFDKLVYVNWIDSIRTKDIVRSVGELDAVKYGNDPIQIVGNWVTIVEDGYLTLSFRALWGNTAIAHEINLVSGTDPENPYVLELRHNALEDNYHLNPIMAAGVIAFDLSSLPSTGGEDVDLVIRYKDIVSGKDTQVKFGYNTGESTESGEMPDLAKIDKSLKID